MQQPTPGISSSPSIYQNPTLVYYFIIIIQCKSEYKINSKMGNIEIKDRPKKNQTIFGKRQSSKSPSPFKEAVSPRHPYYRDFSPIKYAQTNTNIRKSLLIEQKKNQMNSNSLKKQDFNRSFSKGLASGRKQFDNSNQNKVKCQEIIKKVRNFNDFLIQLKKKLNQDCNWKGEQKLTLKREISMNVKLQNERVQLEKYKKLVERELSKTHSIQNICISNTGNGQKILTIQYENTNNFAEAQNVRQKNLIKQNFSEYKNQNQNVFDMTQMDSNSYKFEDTKPLKLNSRILAEQKLLRQSKTLIAALKKKCNQLTQQLGRQDAQQIQGSNLEFLLKQKQKNVRIDGLLQNLQETNRQSLQIQRRVRKMIQ